MHALDKNNLYIRAYENDLRLYPQLGGNELHSGWIL